jgi:hypothetical protein
VVVITHRVHSGVCSRVASLFTTDQCEQWVNSQLYSQVCNNNHQPPTANHHKYKQVEGEREEKKKNEEKCRQEKPQDKQIKPTNTSSSG